MLWFAAALSMMTASVAAETAIDVVEPNPKEMSQADIRAFNAKLDKTHKFYIRCKRSAATGSYVQRETSCRTNAQWVLADAQGNQEARDVGERMASKAVTSN